MIDRQTLERRLAEFPLYAFEWIDPKRLEFSEKVRWICREECPRYGQSWSCPPAVGTVEQCAQRCRAYVSCLMIVTAREEGMDPAEHEAVTKAVEKLLQELGANPYTLSAQSCGECARCAYLEGQSCRFPDKMRPCVEGHGILVTPLLERCGGGELWLSLLFYNE